MSDEFVDSSSTPESSAPSAPAPSAPASEPQAQEQQQQQQQQQPPFHMHPRFQQLTRENRELKQQLGQLVNRMQSIESRAEQRGGATPEEQRQYAEAAQALERVMQANPRMARLLQIAERWDGVEQGQQTLQEMQVEQAQAKMQNALSRIGNLLKDANIAVEKDHMPMIAALVARAAFQLPDGNERYRRGDLTVLDEAFASVKKFIETFRKDGAAATAQVKDKTKKLPPAPRGGVAGPEAQPKLKSGDDARAFESGMHKRATDMLKGMLSGS